MMMHTRSRKFFVIMILTLFLISCKSNYSLILDGQTYKFKEMKILNFIDDFAENTEEIKINDSEKINKIINLLEDNLTLSIDNDGVDSAPIKGSLRIYFDNYNILLIKDNFYKDKYYYTFYFDGKYKNFTSDTDLVEKIYEII